MWQTGNVTISPAAAALLTAAGTSAESLLERYRAGEWGELDAYHASFGAFALAHGLPVMSRYTLPGGAVVALITSADRGETRLLTLAEAEPAEVSVEEGYARWAGSYDDELNQLIAVEQRAVDRLLADFAGRDVLDAATGTGRHALALARRGARDRDRQLTRDAGAGQ